MMEDLLKLMVTPLVDKPEAIDIRLVERSNATVLELRVDPDDMGRVIGRGGKRAQALRSIMKAKANALGERIFIDIVD